MPTELVVSLIGFGTAAVGLAAAYISRTRHVVHRHEHVSPSDLGRVTTDLRDVPLKADEPSPNITLETSGTGYSGAPGLEIANDEEEDPETPASTPEQEPTRANKYARAALRAVDIIRASGRVTPPDAWETATTEIFGPGTPAQKKGCPKDAFLGLCQSGYVADVPAGEYTRSERNREYAIAAAEALASDPSLAGEVEALWTRALGGEVKKHNSQMHVVIALWQSGLLRSGKPAGRL